MLSAIALGLILASPSAAIALSEVLTTVNIHGQWWFVAHNIETKTSKLISQLPQGVTPALQAVSFHGGKAVAMRTYEDHNRSIRVLDVASGRNAGSVTLDSSIVMLIMSTSDGRLLTMTEERIKATWFETTYDERTRSCRTRRLELPPEAGSRVRSIKSAWLEALAKSGKTVGYSVHGGGAVSADDAFDDPGKYGSISADGRKCAALTRPNQQATVALELELFQAKDPLKPEIGHYKTVPIDTGEIKQQMVVDDWLIVRYKDGNCEVRKYAEPEKVEWTFTAGFLITPARH